MIIRSNHSFHRLPIRFLKNSPLFAHTELGKRAYEGEDVTAEAAKKVKRAKTEDEDSADPPALLEGVKVTNAEKRARTRKQKRALAAKLQDDNTVCYMLWFLACTSQYSCFLGVI